MSAPSQSQPHSQLQQRSQSRPRSHSQRNHQPHAFEFTKRKKWADILVANVPDTIYLLLDLSGCVQYASPGITDLLGWESEELLDRNVLDLLNDDDKKRFSKRLHASLTGQQDLLCYARLKRRATPNASTDTGDALQCTQPKELLFEICGHARPNDDDNASKCFYFMAKPYPSRNRAMLNTFFELKIENERLTEFLKELKLQETPGPLSKPSSSTSTTVSPSQYAHGSTCGTDNSLIYHSGSGNVRDGKASQDSTGLARQAANGGTSSVIAKEDEDEGGKKKKLKKHHTSDNQHVCFTCGRTDSPEWRKGPRGPKTLCNACGLRWAKRSKKPEDGNGNVIAGPGGAASGFNSDAGGGSSEREKRGKEGTQSPGNVVSANGGGGTSSSGNSHNSKRVPVSHAALSVTPIPRNGPNQAMIQRRTQTPSVPPAPPLPPSSAPMQSLQSLCPPQEYAMQQLTSSSAGMTLGGIESFAETLGLGMPSGIRSTAPSPAGMNLQSHNLTHAQVHPVQGYMQVMTVPNGFADVGVYDNYAAWDMGNVAVPHGIVLPVGGCGSIQNDSAQHGEAHTNHHTYQQQHQQSPEYNMPFSNY